jgi:hypothetical protein
VKTHVNALLFGQMGIATISSRPSHMVDTSAWCRSGSEGATAVPFGSEDLA